MRQRVPRPLALLGGLLALYLLAPLVAGVRQAAQSHWRALGSPALWHACGVSIASATTSTLILAITGIPLAYHLARRSGRFATAVGFIVQLPLALPPLASGILLLFLVGPRGALGHLVGNAFTDSVAGIVLAETFVAAPFVVVAARTAFASMDPDLEAVAATLGHRPLGTFLRVSLPSAKYGLLAGLLLAWLRAFGEFGATMMVAYHPYSLPVYSYVAFGARGLPAMLPILLPTLALALAVMVLAGLAGARARAPVRRARRLRAVRAGRATAPPLPPASPPSDPPDGLDALAIDLARTMGEFELRLAWTPSSRRLAILGPSGSGKSLTLKLIAGLERAEQAVVRIGGRELAGLEPDLRRVGYVPQSYALFPHLDVQRQLRFPAGADPALAERWLERLELTDLRGRRPAQLSLGQQQRVALARALVRPVDLLLLDEPFSALDAPLRAALRRELRVLQSELPLITLLVTHDPGEAMLLADDILLLCDGRPLQSGPAAAVLRRPVNERAARLLGADNIAAGLAEGPGRLALGPGVALELPGPALPVGRVGWCVPADRVWLHGAGRYRGTVEALVPGPLPRAMIRCGEACIGAACAADLAPGQSVRFDLDVERVQVWPLP